MHVYSDNEIYQYFTRKHISYSLNGRTSAALHSIKKPRRHFDEALIPLNADSSGGICFFFLRCVKPELCHGRVISCSLKSLMTGKSFKVVVNKLLFHVFNQNFQHKSA